MTTSTLIITIPEARKLLGKEAKNFSDETIERIIRSFTAIARIYIQSIPKY